MAAEVQSRAAIDAQLLARFEAQVELPAWFMTRGFQIAPLQPDPGKIAMTGPGLEVFHLRKDLERGTWSYTNTANPTDRGTVVDFMCKHEGATLATCLSRLGGCVFRSHLSPEGIAYQEVVRDRSDTLHAAVAVHIAALKAEREAIRGLEGLGVNRAAFDETRFGRLRDSRDAAALLRNPTTLEHSRYRPTDRQVVLVERPLDAIAYEQKHGKGRACYIYTGDNPDLQTKRQIAHLLAEIPEGMKVVLAVARDRQGNDLAQDLARLAPALKPERHAPEFGARWSDQMRLEHRHQRSARCLSAGIQR
jgi:hypothetical protein